MNDPPENDSVPDPAAGSVQHLTGWKQQPYMIHRGTAVQLQGYIPAPSAPARRYHNRDRP